MSEKERKNKTISSAVATIIAAAMNQNASADTFVDSIRPAAYQQTNTGYARAGMTAKGYTDAHYLYAGGGFTITCVGGAATIDIQQSAYFSSGNGTWRSVPVPPSPAPGGVGSWYVPGFNSWPYDEDHDCWVNYKALARGADAEGGVSIGGNGFNLSFNVAFPPSEVIQSSQTSFRMRRAEPACTTCCQ